MMFRPIFPMVFLFLILHSGCNAMKLVKIAAEVEEEAAPDEALANPEEDGAEEIMPELKPEVAGEPPEDDEVESEAPVADVEPEAEEEPEEVPELKPEVEPEAEEETEEEPEEEPEEVPELKPEVEPEAEEEPEEVPELKPEEPEDVADPDEADDDSASEPDDSIPDGESLPVPDDETNEIDSDDIDADSGLDVDEEFPFQGGFAFDTPFFSFEQAENYFRNLERAMETIFHKTMESVRANPNAYENSTDHIVVVDGRKYLVHTTIIRAGDENSSVSIEAVSAIPADKRKKRSLF